MILPLLERLSLNKDFKLKPFKAQINAPLKLKSERTHLILGNYLNNQLIDEGVGLVQGEIEILRFEN
ncbi:hypothetical protein VN0558_03850 [Helicobacter pylori]